MILSYACICLMLCSMQLGDGSTTLSYTPKSIPGISGAVIAVAAGYQHTCAVTALGAFCWGYNEYYQVNCTRNAPHGVFHLIITHCRTVTVPGVGRGQRIMCQRQYSDFPVALLR